MPDKDTRKPDILPIVVIVALVGLIGAAIWLFPYLQDYVQHQNCVGVGRVDCG